VAIPLSKEVSVLKSSLRFIYFYCNELNKVRTFYSELIQLHEIYFEDHASVAYQCDQLQFSFSQITEKLPVHEQVKTIRMKDFLFWRLQDGTL
jgi:hypothetical protein